MSAHVCTECTRPAHYAMQDPTRTGASKGSTTTRFVCDLHAVVALLTLRETVELYRAARTRQPLSPEALDVLDRVLAETPGDHWANGVTAADLVSAR